MGACAVGVDDRSHMSDDAAPSEMQTLVRKEWFNEHLTKYSKLAEIV
jgi:hypothetical protein